MRRIFRALVDRLLTTSVLREGIQLALVNLKDMSKDDCVFKSSLAFSDFDTL